MGSTSSQYKRPRGRRTMQEQAPSNKGIYYTTQEVPAGFAKLLVNYDYTDDGQILKPRQGITNDAILRHSSLDPDSDDLVSLGDAHANGLLYFKGLDNAEYLSEAVLSFGMPLSYANSSENIKQDVYFHPSLDTTNGTDIVRGESGWSLILDKRDNNKFLARPYFLGHFSKATNAADSVGLIRTKSFNNIDVFNTGVNSVSVSRPTQVNYNGYIYTICTAALKDVDGTLTSADPTFKIARLRIQEEDVNSDTPFVIKREPVTAKVPNITEAMSVGFNMLLEEPYEFPNTSGSTDAKGIIAYRPDEGVSGPLGEVLFTANNGEVLRLNLVYSYEAGANYKVAWEYKSLADENWTMLQDFAPVTVGVEEHIYYDLTPTHDIFSVRATMRKTQARTCTATIANPGVITLNGHGLSPEQPIIFSTTGALPTGIVAGQTYYVKDVLTVNTFTITSSVAGSAITTSGTQSGTHTLTNDDLASDRLAHLSRFELNVDSLKNLGTELFDLSTATGMFSFNNMLGLYGVQGAETTLFFSDMENPGYFPFPHNIHSFDEQILKVINYLDSLIVVTTTSIYAVSGKGLPNTFIVKKIITNLNITELDADLIKVIKDQVFFKADNTFFILKPNAYTGDATDLRVMEVSKGINTFVQNFKTNTLDLFNDLYPLRLTEPELTDNIVEDNRYMYDNLVIKGYNQHVVDGKLQIVIRLELTSDNTTLNTDPLRFSNQADLVMIYDTLTKQWYFQVYSLLPMGAVRHRRIDNQSILLFDKAEINNDRYLIIARYDSDPRDYYEDTTLGFSVTPKIRNWQINDAGIIPMSNAVYKRLRELQFTINNIDQVPLHFYSKVLADGASVLESSRFEVQQITDVNAADYGHIYINKYDDINLEVPGATTADAWELDFSRFPENYYIRVHVELTGKGRFISSVIINRDEKRYELSNTIWVIRPMNGR